MSNGPSYVKTPKGLEEMSGRANGLSQRARRLLILIDGTRAQAALERMLPGENVPSLLESLVAGDFIAARAAPAAPLPQGVPAPADEAERFAMARNFMINTVSAFLGIVASGLLERLERCASLDELRANFEAWRDAMLLSREGRQEAPELERRLAALLS